MALVPALAVTAGLAIALADRTSTSSSSAQQAQEAGIEGTAEDVVASADSSAPQPTSAAESSPGESATEEDGEDQREAPPVQVTFLPTPAPTPIASPTPAVVDELPDLRPLNDFLQNYYFEPFVGGSILRFDTGFGNWGLGAFEMHGARAAVTDEMTAYQRIYRSDGTYHDVESGTLQYTDSHLHWHITDLALYELLDATGKAVITNNKAGFCLLDTYFVEPRPPGGPDFPVFYFCTTGYQDTLLVTSMGLSSGWYDIYEAWLPDQELDVSGLPPGQYLLRITVDANERILESDETNNTISLEITLP